MLPRLARLLFLADDDGGVGVAWEEGTVVSLYNSAWLVHTHRLAHHERRRQAGSGRRCIHTDVTTYEPHTSSTRL